MFKNRFVRYGMPFLLLMVGGSFALREFSQLRYQFSKKKLIRPDDLKQLGIETKKPEEMTLEAQYDELTKMNIDNWENKRGPRPWEEDTS